jgi:hypothetical protein
MKDRLSRAMLMAVLVSVVGLLGCNGAGPAAGPPGESAEHADHDHAHAHPDEGPHHGHLIELGEEEYHAELTHDEASKTVTVYLLGKDAKQPVAIGDPEIALNLAVDGQPLQATLTAQPQEGDAEGQASRFSLTDEKVLEALESPKATGRLTVTIEGKTYSGTIEHHDHGEH